MGFCFTSFSSGGAFEVPALVLSRAGSLASPLDSPLDSPLASNSAAAASACSFSSAIFNIRSALIYRNIYKSCGNEIKFYSLGQLTSKSYHIQPFSLLRGLLLPHRLAFQITGEFIFGRNWLQSRALRTSTFTLLRRRLGILHLSLRHFNRRKHSFVWGAYVEVWSVDAAG